MSIQKRITLIVALVFFLCGLALFGIHRLVVLPGFLELEEEKARTDYERVVHGLQREIVYLRTVLHDWTAWDDTYAFIRTVSPAYIESNLVLTAFTDNKLNLIHYYDLQGRLVWGEIRELPEGELLVLPEFSAKTLPAGSPLLAYERQEDKLAQSQVSGLMRTSRGIMLVAARPILTGSNTGPILGTMVMGRFLSGQMVQSLQNQTQVDFTVSPLAGDSGAAQAGSGPDLDRSREDLLYVSGLLPDLDGKPALAIRAGISRDIKDKGRATLLYAFVLLIATGIILLITFLRLMRRLVILPITTLTGHILTIGKSGDLSENLEKHRYQDEIGILTEEFERMLAQIAEMRKAAMNQSYFSGMSEAASGVLHNVRNALSPIINTLERLQEAFLEVPWNEIDTAREQLATAPPAGREQKTLDSVVRSNQDLLHFLRFVEKNTHELLHKIGALESILNECQKLFFRPKPMEEVAIASIVRDALQFVTPLPPGLALKVDPGVEGAGLVNGPRLTYIQLVVVLLSNAVESVLSRRLRDGMVEIGAGVEPGADHEEMVHWRVCDNGAGIAPEHLSAIFSGDFSNKKEGGGFGLHWCANAVIALNGRIYAESQGPGQGCCLHLLLPRVHKKVPHD